MQNLIRITVKPHVGTYLRFHFGQRMSLTDKNIISMALRTLFEHFDKLDPFQIKGQRKEYLGDFFEVYVSDNLLRKVGGHLSNDSITAFNDAVDLIIKQDMYRWCNHPNADHKEVDYNIKRFINFYKFSEDNLTFDNLKRWYYRERERIAKRKCAEEFPDPALVITAAKTYVPANNSTVQLSLL